MFKNRIVYVAIIALFALVFCYDNPSDAAEPYAAFAVVPGKGATFHGFAQAETRSKARRQARSACGRRKCTVVQEYRKGQCAHVVLGTFQVFWNEVGFTRARGREILAHCKKFDEGCRVVVAECL